jgi:hypothetical protein
LIQLAKASATNPDDQNLQKLLLDAGKDVVQSLVKLTEASKGIVPKKVNFLKKKMKKVGRKKKLKKKKLKKKKGSNKIILIRIL